MWQKCHTNTMRFRLTYIWYKKSQTICGLILKITSYDNTKYQLSCWIICFLFVIIAWANSCGNKISFSLSSFAKFGGGIFAQDAGETPKPRILLENEALTVVRNNIASKYHGIHASWTPLISTQVRTSAYMYSYAITHTRSHALFVGTHSHVISVPLSLYLSSHLTQLSEAEAV